MGKEGILEVGNSSGPFQFENLRERPPDHRERLPGIETGKKVVLTLTWPDLGSRKPGKKLRAVLGGNLGPGGLVREVIS